MLRLAEEHGEDGFCLRELGLISIKMGEYAVLFLGREQGVLVKLLVGGGDEIVYEGLEVVAEALDGGGAEEVGVVFE